MLQDDSGDIVSYDIGGRCTVGIEKGICPELQMKLGHRRSDGSQNDLIVKRGQSLEIHENLKDRLTFVNDGYRPVVVAMSPLADEMLVKDGSYEIVHNGGVFAISPTGITCHGVVHGPYVEHYLLRPLINTLLMPKGAILAHGGAVSFEGKVLLFLGESGKTSLLLELLSRGAKYMAEEYSVLDSDGTCTMYTPYIWMDDHHFIHYPELLGTSYPEPMKRKKVEKNISFFRMGYLGFRGDNFFSRQARALITSRTYFDGLTCRFDLPFPQAELRESGKIDHVFHLESRETDELIAPTTAQDIAEVESSALCIRHCYHDILAGMAKIRQNSYEGTRITMENALRRAECHRIGIKLRAERTRDDFREVVDTMLELI